jgi:hypothetical protein
MRSFPSVSRSPASGAGTGVAPRAIQAGYPSHLDATCGHGKGGVFVCMDGWRGWVLMAARIPSQHGGYLRPWVEKTAALFGDPIATVRDMGEGMAKAVAPLRARECLILSATNTLWAPWARSFSRSPIAYWAISCANTKYRATGCTLALQLQRENSAICSLLLS